MIPIKLPVNAGKVIFTLSAAFRYISARCACDNPSGEQPADSARFTADNAKFNPVNPSPVFSAPIRCN